MEDKKINFVLSDQTFDRREDIYAFNSFGKTVNRFSLNVQVFSDDFWKYLNDNFSIKQENITVFCEINSDVKNRIEKMYRYVINIEKPYKILLQFYDEEKVIDEKIYETEDEQKNKVSDISLYFNNSEFENINKLIEDINKMIFLQPINKSFFIISTSSLGYDLRTANIKDYDIPIDLNYGDSFVDKYKDIVGKLRNNKHGLFLFHGDPGTGKCVDGSTMVTLRNKITGEIENISVEDFEKIL